MRLKPLVALLVIALCVFFSVQNIHASNQPQIVKIYRTPLNPPPGFDVNVTCSIIDQYGLVNVSLYYTINASSFNQATTQIIDGDYFNGTFQGKIPAQPEGTFLTYFIEAKDSIGYITQTQNDSYTVSPDETPPTVLSLEIVNPASKTVLPSESVTIMAVITDDGSGVKNATLFYGLSRDWGDTNNYNGISMYKNSSDAYNCSFIGIIKAQFTNQTMISYYIKATDYANNTSQDSLIKSFYVAEVTTSYMRINIFISNVDDKTLTANATINIEGLLPNYDDSQPVNIQLFNGRNQGSSANFYFLQLNSSSDIGERFGYYGTWMYNFYLLGDRPGESNFYPFDHYFLNFTFKVFWSAPQDVSVSIFDGDRSQNTWNIRQSQQLNTTDSYGQPILVGTVEIARNTSSNGTVFPLILLVVTLFFVLGGTLLVEPARLNERLTVFLAIFIFGAGFFFSLGSTVPLRIGFTSIEILFLYLIIGSGLLTVGSFFSKGVSAYFDQNLNLNYFLNPLKFSNKLIGSIVVRVLRICGLIRRNLGLLVDLCLTLLLYWLIKDALIGLPIASLVVLGVFFGIGFRIILKISLFFARKKLHREIV